MTTITALLSADHRQCDGLFAEAERAADAGVADEARRQFELFASALLNHFTIEEATLFPAFEAATGSDAGPTAVMRREHAQMRALLTEMADALAAGSTEEYLGLAETLLILNQQHNAKEEQILYPMCDRMLPDAERLAGSMQRLAS